MRRLKDKMLSCIDQYFLASRKVPSKEKDDVLVGITDSFYDRISKFLSAELLMRGRLTGSDGEKRIQ